MAHLLLVEDDKPLNEGIKIALEKDGHEVAAVGGFFEALKLTKKESFELLLLDIGLPDGNGLTLCRKIREKTDAPVVFLTANDTEADMLSGYRAGCNDYIAKPFSVNVLRQKVLALLKLGGAQSTSNVFESGGLTVDFDKKAAFLDGTDCKLTATEFKLLEYMVNNKNKVLTRSMLIEQLWDIDGSFIDENTLSVHIKRLRGKLERDSKKPEFIKTVFGIGYTFGA